MTKGRLLYDKYRRHEADAVHWNYLPAPDRDFWERLANVVATDASHRAGALV